ncbi:MAG TPA: DUF2184 domain-containing protein [Pseudomonas sp.]|uniref:DUF2184 domain-containing protein n=1 Tax=Pseudomonas sp. TaxID=306 RepID=UPI002CA09F3B|nr:DUF2184 domain-containing protein [Pseudomonas sp.]HWH86168.1 DUF2184 domain-containing protein [Pseudomonas sp.]
MSQLEFMRLASIGISNFPQQWMTPEAKTRIAQDAAMVTTPNNGVPAWMTQYTSPTLIKVLTAKRAAEEIFDPVRYGSYGTTVASFPIVESTGKIAPYSDQGREGSASFNANWPQREAYYFQTIVEWGDLEMATMSAAKINAAVQKQEAAAQTIKIAHNDIWFNGVANLANYGILNDPSLNAALTPATSAGGDLEWFDKDTIEIYNDILALYTELNRTMGGLLDMDVELELTMSNLVRPTLNKATSFNVSVLTMLKEGFPNLKIITAPQMSTAAGEMVMMIAPNVEGQKTGDLGYVELMRAHGVVRELSSLKEKYSAATFGSVMYRSAAVSSMLGV